jgi:3D (Asp-Asp-Asp) domain-containing protein
MSKYLILIAVFWQTLNISAYTYSGNPTASGVYPAVGHCAADHLPFGARVTLPDGRTLTVTDRFGGGFTDKLDIFMETESECWKWGRKTLKCKVEIP